MKELRSSELHALAGAEACMGVIIDVPVFTFPEGLKELGLVADSVNDKGELPVDIVDTLIAATVSNLKVTLEVPFTLAVDVNYLLEVFAGSLGVGVAFLPPESDDDAAWEAYCEGRLLPSVDFLMESAVCKGEVLPAISYFEYMVQRAFGYTPEKIAEDGYIQERFVDAFPEHRMEAVKPMIEARFLEHFSAIEGDFEGYVAQIALSVASSLKEVSSRMVKEIKLQAAGMTPADPGQADCTQRIEVDPGAAGSVRAD